MTPPRSTVAHLIESMPIAQHLDLRLEEASAERTVISMPIVPHLTFDGTVCQGGVVAMLADFAAVGAAFMAIEGTGRTAATTAMNSHNLRPAYGQRLVAVGRLVGPTGRTMIAAADVYNDSLDGERCLTGLYTATALAAAVRPAA